MSVTDPYDASEQEDRSRSSYLERKDVRIIGIAVIAILLLMLPIYRMMVGDAERHICQNNMGQVMKAVLLYATDNGDRFPVVSAMDYQGNPMLFGEGTDQAIVSWMTSVKGYMSARASFVCPTADKSEYVSNQSTDGIFHSTYGFYAPYSAADINRIKNPGATVLFAETSNHGAKDTFNPVPLIVAGTKDQESPFDGHVIGWDNTELIPVGPELLPRPSLDARFVTRLAFPGTKGGKFTADSDARHSKGINAITAAGSLVVVTPSQAELIRNGKAKEVGGWWATD